MLTSSSLTFLKRLLDSPGPSGYETAAARAWRAEAQTFADIVRSDVAGNSIAEVNPDGSPTIMLDGHIDEIGLIVQYIDDDGYLYVSPIGGWDPEVLAGQRIRFLAAGGDVLGVVGKKPIHLMKPADRDKASKLTDFWVDIGAGNRAEAEARIAVGDAGVIDSRTLDFPNDRVVSRSIDDRIGAFTVLEKKEIGDHKLGSGPVLVRGSLISPVVFDLLRDAARSAGIPYTVHAEGRTTSTNADAIHLARDGVATALVSIPNRYMHSPNEMVSLVDVEHAAALIAEACRGVDARTDFTAR
ncbi:MAG: endoglucanase [Gemmatimonadetes bacterium 21-71-4]|nr:MAG: endoglucanase [Gemmatimonadetes bacterium 21-71-4]